MRRIPFWLVLLLSLLVGLVAVSSDSLWIDEGFSAVRAMEPTLAGWWRSLLTLGGSELQMPLYMFYLWTWEKLCGSSEWALRAANIPWFLLAQFALWTGFRRWPRLRVAAVFCAMCHPLLWRYLNEARPYLMQYAGSSIAVACVAWLAAEEAPVMTAGWVWAMGAGLFILCASNALGVAWAAAALLALVSLLWGRVRLARNLTFEIATVCIALGTLAGYYQWTLRTGTGATGLGGAIPGFVFALYEGLGFAGLGPSRLAVIESYAQAFVPHLPLLAIMAVVLAATLAIGLRIFVRRAGLRLSLAAAAYTLLPPAILLALAFATGFRVLGRHLIPATPVVILTAALAFTSPPGKKRVCAALLAALWLCSSLELRFATRHLRDDYRDATQAANSALRQGKSVWWAASNAACIYYGLPIAWVTPQTGRALVLWSFPPQDLAKLPPPDFVVLSKAILFDQSGSMAAYLHGHGYRQTGAFPAFSLWEK